ncbi:restriction endonuclease subunit S [Staphylococcus sp. SS21]|nr:restriction endonuclease subunit S [Staphylococcus singaporensis]
MRNTQTKNVPELRFPEFEGEWEEKKFADFTKTNQGLQIAINERKTEYSPELYFYITNEFLRPNSQTKYFIENPPQSVIANKEDILMTRTGNTGKVVTNVFGAFHNNFFKIKFDKNLYDRLFLVEVLKSSKIQNKILSLAGTSTIPDLNHSDFYSISSSYPLLKEQKKIGQFFSKLDRQIELEEQKLELLQQQKKGYMQKIFSQELRFKDENGNDYPEWENSKIENYLKERNERSDKGEMLSVTINSGIIKFSELDRKDNSSKDKSNYKVVKKNDIAYNSMRMWQGASGKSNYNGIVSPAYTVLYPTQNTSSLFIGYKFKTHRMIYTFKINSQGLTSDTWNLKYKQLKNIKIDIPALEEQEKIGDFFKKMDLFISKQKMKIEMLEQEKQSLLQKMFV